MRSAPPTRSARPFKIATDELTDPVSKRRMLRIAEDYEELGRRAERRLQQRSKNSN